MSVFVDWKVEIYSMKEAPQSGASKDDIII
jgi:hypothetical protein